MGAATSVVDQVVFRLAHRAATSVVPAMYCRMSAEPPGEQRERERERERETERPSERSGEKERHIEKGKEMSTESEHKDMREKKTHRRRNSLLILPRVQIHIRQQNQSDTNLQPTILAHIHQLQDTGVTGRPQAPVVLKR